MNKKDSKKIKPTSTSKSNVLRTDVGDKILTSDVTDGNEIVKMIYDSPPVTQYDT